MRNHHSIECPAAVTFGTPDHDPEECAGGACAAAIQAVRDSAPWAPVEVRAAAPAPRRRKADAA